MPTSSYWSDGRTFATLTPNANVAIDNNYPIGDALTISRTQKVDSGVTISSIIFNLKEFLSDVSPLIAKTITGSSTASGQITNSGSASPNTAVFNLILLAADTLSLTPRRRYIYEIVFTASDSKSWIQETGTIKFVPRIA